MNNMHDRPAAANIWRGKKNQSNVVVCFKYEEQITQVGTSESCYCLLVQNHHIFDMGNHHVPLLPSNIYTHTHTRPSPDIENLWVLRLFFLEPFIIHPYTSQLFAI